MKYIIASDLHGIVSAYQNLKIISQKENADKIVLLGDIMSEKDNIAEINDILRQINAPIMTVIGNCDMEQKLKMFHVENKSYMFLEKINGRKIFYTHGHIYDLYDLPKILGKDDIFLFGHWHRGMITTKKGVIVGNAGSLALPRNSKASYLVLTDYDLTLKDASGTVLQQLKL